MPQSRLSAARRRHVRLAAALIVTPIAVLALTGTAASAAPTASTSGCTSVLVLRLCVGRTPPPTVAPPVTVPVTTPVTLPVTTTTVPPVRAVHDLTELVPELLAAMNVDRAAAGLPPFRTRTDVNALAQQHSRNMAAKHEIWHNDDYFSGATRSLLAAGAMGQNVALNHSVAGAELAFMASPHHKDNILDGRFSVVGLGVTTDERGLFYVTQDFIQPKGTPRAMPTAGLAAAAAPRAVATGAAKPARSATKAPVAPPPSELLAASAEAGTSVILPVSAAPGEVVVPAVQTMRLVPAGATEDVVGLTALAVLALLVAASALVSQIVRSQEYAKVR